MQERLSRRNLWRTTLLPRFSDPPIRPVYWQSAPNETIEFGQHQVQIGSGGPIEDMNVRLRFLPDARLEFFVPHARAASVEEAIKRWAAPMKTEKLRLVSGNVLFDAFPTERGSEGTIFSPTKEPMEPVGNANGLSRAIVHLFNFPSFRASDDYCLAKNSALSVLGRVILRAEGWEITIAATDRTEENEEALKTQGGYCITHIAEIHRGECIHSPARNCRMYSARCTDFYHSP